MQYNKYCLCNNIAKEKKTHAILIFQTLVWRYWWFTVIFPNPNAHLHAHTYTHMHACTWTNKRIFEVPAYNWVCWQCQRRRFTEIFSFAQPSHAKNTQVGLQLPPFPDLVSTTRSWAKGLSLAMSRVTSISHPKHKLMKQHTTKHQHVGSLWRASRPTTWRSTATGPHTHCACFYCSPDTNNLMLCKARQISKQFKWFPPVSGDEP